MARALLSLLQTLLSSCTDHTAELWSAGEVSGDQYSAATWYRLLQPLCANLKRWARRWLGWASPLPCWGQPGHCLGTAAFCGDRDGHRLHLSLPSGCAQGATFTHVLQSAGSIPVGACHLYSKNWWVSRGKVRKGEGCVRGRISQAVSIHTLITLQCRPEERGQSLLLPAVSPLSWGRENTWLNGQT